MLLNVSFFPMFLESRYFRLFNQRETVCLIPSQLPETHTHPGSGDFSYSWRQLPLLRLHPANHKPCDSASPSPPQPIIKSYSPAWRKLHICHLLYHKLNQLISSKYNLLLTYGLTRCYLSVDMWCNRVLSA